jgi:hypothetical protein
MKLLQGMWPVLSATEKVVEGDGSMSLPSLRDAPPAVCTNIIGGLSPDFSSAATAIQPRHSTIEAAAAQMDRILFIEEAPHLEMFSQEKL